MDINITSQVFTYANLAAFPATGAVKTLYIAIDTDIIYYWDGSQYVATGSAGSSTWGAITGTLSNQTDLQTALDGKVDENAAITGATKTKITYDSKGLVTSGADATTSDIAEGSNLYFTNARALSAAPAETVNTIGSLVNGAADATPNDTDLIPVVESSVTKKITLTNLKAFFKTYLDTLYVSLTGSYANPSWLASLAWSKITGTPTTIAGYGITDAKPVGQWYSDATAVSPADGSIYYFGTINNNAPETANTYRIKSPKNNAVFNVTATAIIRTSLGSAQNSTVKIQNITAGTSETLSTGLTATDRINSVTALSTLANTAGDEMTIEITNPSWVSNPTGVQYQFIVRAY